MWTNSYKIFIICLYFSHYLSVSTQRYEGFHKPNVWVTYLYFSELLIFILGKYCFGTKSKCRNAFLNYHMITFLLNHPSFCPISLVCVCVCVFIHKSLGYCAIDHSGNSRVLWSAVAANFTRKLFNRPIFSLTWYFKLEVCRI